MGIFFYQMLVLTWNVWLVSDSEATPTEFYKLASLETALNSAISVVFRKMLHEGLLFFRETKRLRTCVCVCLCVQMTELFFVSLTQFFWIFFVQVFAKRWPGSQIKTERLSRKGQRGGGGWGRGGAAKETHDTHFQLGAKLKRGS